MLYFFISFDLEITLVKFNPTLKSSKIIPNNSINLLLTYLLEKIKIMLYI